MTCRILDLSYNKIRAIENIDHLFGLQELYFASNKITEIPFLSFQQLRILELGANRLKEVCNLDSLPCLEQLWLGKNKLTKIQNLKSLKSLKILSIQSNLIEKIEGLEELENLEELYLSHNKISKIENLDRNGSLKILDVSSNKVARIENISHLSISELWLNNNLIDNARDLENIPKTVEAIYLEGNQLDAQYKAKIKWLLPNIKQIDAEYLK